MKVSRADTSRFANWWWTVDRYLLTALLTVMIAGIVLSFAASPPIAARLKLDNYYFVIRHIIFAVPALLVMIGVSFLNARQVRRLALLLLIGGIVMMIATLLVGFEAKGARRWLFIAGFSIQPSEFVKPGFVVICAWLFAEGPKRPDIHGHIIAVGLLVLVSGLLILQPDFGHADCHGLGRHFLSCRNAVVFHHRSCRAQRHRDIDRLYSDPLCGGPHR